MAKGAGLKRAVEGGASLVVFSAAQQAVMNRSGSNAGVVARNGAIAGVVSTLLGVGGAWIGRRQPLVSALGTGAAAAGIAGLTALGTQLADEKLMASKTATSQNAIDQVGQATGGAPQDQPAPVALVGARSSYADDSGFETSL